MLMVVVMRYMNDLLLACRLLGQVSAHDVMMQGVLDIVCVIGYWLLKIPRVARMNWIISKSSCPRKSVPAFEDGGGLALKMGCGKQVW